MTDDRADGPTFDPDCICWIDFETKSGTDIKAGTYRYATEADAIVLAYAIGDGPVDTYWNARLPLVWEDMPPPLQTVYDLVCQGKMIFAAWNAGFDRAIWNYATAGFSCLEPHHVIDVMAQAAASGLPPDLNLASKVSGAAHKVAAGKSLIALFCAPGAAGTPQSHPAEWAEFLRYATGDIVAMRDVFRRTRQLPLAEWQEYWAMEAVNERGVGVDLAMVGHAAKLAAEDRERSKTELKQLTDGKVKSVDEVKNMTDWLLDRLPPAGRAILLKREAEIDEETGLEKSPGKYALTRKQVERLIALNEDDTIDRILQIRLYGGSKTPTKFRRIVDGHVDGVLHGQYVFNGAAQTGRASSKGVQVHNLARDALAYEHDAIEALLSGCSYEQLAELGDAAPVSRKLSLLIRPAFVPTVNSSLFVWSDWSQIEARVLPWLCDHIPSARLRLEIFKEVDENPDLPDLYTRTAATLSGTTHSQVTKAMRQRGKIAELALGFGGGRNALQAMAASYSMHLEDAEASTIVEAWREANPWALSFGRELWTAMETARAAPGQLIKAGQVGFCYLPGYLGGTLLCRLPSGRLLTYRAIRYEMVDEKDDDGKVIKTSRELTYARGYGRQKLWPGIFVENTTQAVAADILRGTLVRLEREGFCVRGSTHDEIICEVAEAQAGSFAKKLHHQMCRGFDWSKGLPLMSHETAGFYYSKNETSTWAL